jgi:hypothetical protein
MKKIFYILLIINCSLLIVNCTLNIENCFCQLVQQEWVARYPGPSNDLYGPYLAVDKQGNSYVAGTHVVNDTINILCVKYNNSGVQQWAKLYKYPGEGYFAPTGLALDSSGNAYVISDYSINSVLPRNGLIVKFDRSTGSTVWAKRHIGEYGWSAFRDIKIDRFDNIYVAGWADTSHLVIKYNTNGDSVWVRKYHPPSCREVTRACTLDDSLNIIITGQRFHYYPYGSVDSLLVAKYSNGGVLRWESVYVYTPLVENVGKKIVSDQNGNVYIGGYTSVSGDLVYLTLKYDRNGVRQWSAIYNPPGNGSNEIYAIAIDRMNNALFVSGYSVINSVGSAATIKYNTSIGDSAWVRRGFGVQGSSSAWDVEVDSSGNAYITGSSTVVSNPDVSTLKYSTLGNIVWFITYNGTFNGGDGGRALEINRNDVYALGYSQSSAQVADYVVIKYNQIMSISLIANEIPTDFGLEQNYPNPFNASSKFNLQISKLSIVKVTAYDILGREIGDLVNEKLKPGTYKVSIDGANYPSGIYFYRMVADGIIINTKKFIVLK